MILRFDALYSQAFSVVYMQIVQTVQLQLLLAIRAFFVEFADACDLGAVSDSALRLGLDFKNVAEGQVRNSDIGPGSFKCMILCDICTLLSKIIMVNGLTS